MLFDAEPEPQVEIEQYKTPSFRSLVSVDDKPKYKKLYNCLCCGSPHLFVILDLGKQPLANNFHTIDDVQEEYELILMGCDNCWHSQLNVVVDPDVLFKNYLYVSGTSNTLKEYFNKTAEDYSMGRTMPGKILDIACNDGTLLDSFKDKGWITFGVDPAENLHPISTGKGHNVICDYWSPAIASTLPKFDVIFAQNVFAHTSEIDAFLQACAMVMHNASSLVIETSQADMFDNNQFDTIYHEHISYFSISSMKHAVERAGLFINNVYKTDIHGTSYRFQLQKTDPREDREANELSKESYKYNRDFYDKYRDSVSNCLENLKNYINSAGKKVIGYGAAAKGMTVINAGQLKLNYIVDDNPLKQGLLCPGSDIPVQNSSILKQETGDLIIVIFAWNFYDEIYAKIKSLRPNNNDKFITYFPKLVERV